MKKKKKKEKLRIIQSLNRISRRGNDLVLIYTRHFCPIGYCTRLVGVVRVIVGNYLYIPASSDGGGEGGGGGILERSVSRAVSCTSCVLPSL